MSEPNLQLAYSGLYLLSVGRLIAAYLIATTAKPGRRRPGRGAEDGRTSTRHTTPTGGARAREPTTNPDILTHSSRRGAITRHWDIASAAGYQRLGGCNHEHSTRADRPRRPARAARLILVEPTKAPSHNRPDNQNAPIYVSLHAGGAERRDSGPAPGAANDAIRLRRPDRAL